MHTLCLGVCGLDHFPCGPARCLGEGCTAHLSTPSPLPQAPVSAPGWDEIRESRFHCLIRGHLLPQCGVRGVWGRPGRPRRDSPSAAQLERAPHLTGPRAAGAAEVHGDGGLLELRHLGLRVHHWLPAVPAQLAASAVVSEPWARPPGGCPPPLPDSTSPSRSRGGPQARPETPVAWHPEGVLWAWHEHSLSSKSPGF